MAFETINDTLRHTRLPNESAEYTGKREELRLAEVELMRQRERVADLRRKLPKGAVVQDYMFEEGPARLEAGDTPTRTVRLGDLFTAPDRSLVIYHFMYGKRNTEPCPMCTLLTDSLNGSAHHVAQNVDLAIVAAADPPALRKHARARGWNNLRLLSCGTNTFKYDLLSEDREGRQDSAMSVFTRDGDGALRHFYTGHPWLAEDIRERGLDLLSPVYHLLDFTPQGRGDWYAKLDYGVKANV
ncbi:MAG TPA: DUF899 family protein [Candidatus Limnocylindrales bacterium]|jgi:predicted dithiol-disulfide oxidoreductase (DUF899 family)|nr:DUF899 family protein [Candidatus Limnocylindrales bacterium]